MTLNRSVDMALQLWYSLTERNSQLVSRAKPASRQTRSRCEYRNPSPDRFCTPNGDLLAHRLCGLVTNRRMGMDLILQVCTDSTPTMTLWQPGRKTDLDMSQRTIVDRALARLRQVSCA